MFSSSPRNGVGDMIEFARIMRPILTALVTAWLTCAPAFGMIRAARSRPYHQSLGRLPGMRLGFEQEGALYVARGVDYRLSVSAAETVLTYFEGFGDVDNWFREEAIRLRLEGASVSAGAGASRGSPRFSQVYPGIDLVCEGTPQRIEYRFIAAADSDAGSIRIHLEGAGRISVEHDGAVTAITPLGAIRLHPPITYDRFDGERRPARGHFVVRRDGRIRFETRLN